MSDNLATNFYVEFQTVVQRIGDDTLAEDVATWARKAVLDDIREWNQRRWDRTAKGSENDVRAEYFDADLDAYAKENDCE